MTNPLDRSLKDMNNQDHDEEETKMSADLEAMERLEVDELEELGRQITQAYLLSGEPPSTAALEWAERKIDLPSMRAEDVARLTADLRRRVERKLQEMSGAQSIGALIERARRDLGMDEGAAASVAGLPLPAYHQLENARMPIWRAPASKVARLCRVLGIDGSLVLRWASVVTTSSRGAAYGRLDASNDMRTELLSKLAADADQRIVQDFSQWRQEFIDAYRSASKGDAPLGQ
jgi:hypothetical protein